MAAKNTTTPTVEQRAIGNNKIGGEWPTADADPTAAGLELRATNSSTNTKSHDGTASGAGGMAGRSVTLGTSEQRLVESEGPDGDGYAVAPAREFKVYRRRWFALGHLSLLNIIVSWDVSLHAIPTLTQIASGAFETLRKWRTDFVLLQWLTFSAVSSTSADYFGVSENAVNWLSTGFLFAFVAISP